MYMTLFEANIKLDKGDIYLQEKMVLEGHELSDEIRHIQALKTFELVFKFIENISSIERTKQVGKSTFYPKRISKDSELNIKKTIAEQFNLLRVVDNKKYPAFFYYMGKRYIIKIYKDE